MPNSSHLIERAAARLSAAGAVPGGLGSAGASPIIDQPAARLPPQADMAPALAMALLEKAGLMVDQAASGRISEELWLVQRQVLRTAFARSEGAEAAAAPANLLMLTSARPGEGKSFTALNLAAGVARQGDHKVLLVDTDVKARSLTDLLGLRTTTGLLDLAADGGLDPARLEHPTAVPGLAVLPAGGARARSSDLLASRQVGRLLHGLAGRHPGRLVILDGAPCLVTSDPAALAPVVGQIIMVVEADRTQRADVEAALDLIGENPAITLMLNKMRPGGGHAFGAYAPYYTS